MAVMECEPATAKALVKVAVELVVPGLRVEAPRTLVPSLKVAVPVGRPAPGARAVKVAVKMTGWPATDGLTEEATVLVVLALLTVWGGGEGDRLAKHGRVHGRGHGRGGGGLVDRLGEWRGGVVAGGEVGVTAVGGGDGVGGCGKVPYRDTGSAAGQSDRAAGGRAVNGELDSAGARACARRNGADGGREGDALAEDRRVG